MENILIWAKLVMSLLKMDMEEIFFKTGKALSLDKNNIDFVNKKKDELDKKNNELKKSAKISKLINNKKLIFKKESKENGDLFGSIKPKEISILIKEKFKVDVVPSQLILKRGSK